MGRQMPVSENERFVPQEPPGGVLLRFVTFELGLATFEKGWSTWDSECYRNLDTLSIKIAISLNRQM